MRPPSILYKLALILVTLPVLHCQELNKLVIYQVVVDHFLDCSAGIDGRNELPNLCELRYRQNHLSKGSASEAERQRIHEWAREK